MQRQRSDRSRSSPPCSERSIVIFDAARLVWPNYLSSHEGKSIRASLTIRSLMVTGWMRTLWTETMRLYQFQRVSNFRHESLGIWQSPSRERRALQMVMSDIRHQVSHCFQYMSYDGMMNVIAIISQQVDIDWLGKWMGQGNEETYPVSIGSDPLRKYITPRVD